MLYSSWPIDAADAEHLSVRTPSMGQAALERGAGVAGGRVSTLRAYDRYLSALDPATKIPPTVYIPAPSHSYM